MLPKSNKLLQRLRRAWASLSGGLLILAAAVSCGTTHAQGVLEPVDEGAGNEGFAAFRQTLLDAVARKDSQFILSILSEDIRHSFGDNGGVAGFQKQWKLDEQDSAFWPEFEAVLRLGGVFRTPNEFWAPYVYAKWPESLDAFEYAAVTGEHVNIRSGPSTTAPVIAKLSHDLVRLAQAGPVAAWSKITLADGETGYISKRYLRSPVDYRASFVRQGGRWILQVFVAGD